MEVSRFGEKSDYQLLGRVNELILLVSDILWRSECNDPENQYREYFEGYLSVNCGGLPLRD
jgi:hypothetical protein